MTTINISDFQSIKNLNLVVDGFTVLKGDSNIGKSAVRRAINFALFNNWSTAFLRKGSTNTKITFSRDDLNIKRVKGKENTISVNDNHYEKLGSSSPEELKNYGIKLLETTDSEYNIVVSSQLDRLFLSSFNDTEQHKVINAIIGTQKHEDAVRLVTKDLNSLNQEFKQVNDQLLAVESEENDLSSVISMLEKVDNIIKSINSVDSYIETSLNIKKLRKKLGTFNSSINTISSYMELTSFIDKVSKLETKRSSYKLVASCQTNLSNFIALSSFISSKSKISNTSNKVRLCKSSKNITDFLIYLDLKNSYSTLNKKLESGRDLHALISNVEVNQNQINELDKYGKAINEHSSSVSKLVSQRLVVIKLNSLIALLNYIKMSESIYENINLISNWKDELVSLEKEIELHVKICPTCGQKVQK